MQPERSSPHGSSARTRCRRATRCVRASRGHLSVSDLLLRADGDGPLITPESAGWTYCGLHVVRLEPGESRTIATGNDELAVLPLAGSATVEIDGLTFELEGRETVFARITDWAYAPIESE